MNFTHARSADIQELGKWPEFDNQKKSGHQVI